MYLREVQGKAISRRRCKGLSKGKLPQLEFVIRTEETEAEGDFRGFFLTWMEISGAWKVCERIHQKKS